MKTYLYSTGRAAALCFALLVTSCGTPQNVNTGGTPQNGAATGVQAGDQVVVTAEKTLRTAKDTFDLFLHLEYDNREALASVSPEIHKYAEFVRRNAPDWLQTANNLKNAYKHNRTPDNKASLLTALATITEAVGQTQKYIAQANTRSP